MTKLDKMIEYLKDDECAEELFALRTELETRHHEYLKLDNENAALKSRLAEASEELTERRNGFELMTDRLIATEKRLAEVEAAPLKCPNCNTVLSTQDGYWYCPNSECGQAPEDLEKCGTNTLGQPTAEVEKNYCEKCNAVICEGCPLYNDKENVRNETESQ